MRPRVLVCDDEPHIKSGFDVETVDNATAAWDALEREVPDLLISDCQMPGADGLALCRRIRDDFRFSDLPIVLLTAKSYELPTKVLQRDLQISAIVDKPFSPRNLLQLVQLLTGSEEPAV